jgi:hypothetical protein
MTPLAISLLVFALVFVSTLAGMALRANLPEPHLKRTRKASLSWVSG